MYASWCDYEFYDVAVTVSELATEGKQEEALTVSRKVVVDFGLVRLRHGSDIEPLRSVKRTVRWIGHNLMKQFS